MSRVASARSARPKSSAAPSPAMKALQEYFARSSVPLTMLVFLAPMIVLYEIGTRYYAYDVNSHTETRVLAFNLMRQFLELFGASGRYLPCLAVVGILLAWHMARRDRWTLEVRTAGWMAVESALLGIPLLALGNILGYCLPLAGASETFRGGIVLALGAGVYEELVFRLMGFTLLNMLLVDLLRMQKRPAYVLIVVCSSVLFAAYHYWSPQAAQFRWSDFVFRTAAGVYFGGLFLTRGFGITAGSHAAYDIYYFALRASVL